MSPILAKQNQGILLLLPVFLFFFSVFLFCFVFFFRFLFLFCFILFFYFLFEPVDRWGWTKVTGPMTFIQNVL